MEKKWTPEPWNVGHGHCQVIYHDCYPIAFTHDGRAEEWVIPNPLGKEKAEANAKRAVSCVNALAGIENPEEFVKEAVELRKQRDEMLEACKKFVERFSSGQLEKCDVACEMAKAAIFKAEGK